MLSSCQVGGSFDFESLEKNVEPPNKQANNVVEASKPSADPLPAAAADEVTDYNLSSFIDQAFFVSLRFSLI